MSDKIIVLCTCGSADEAEGIARRLVALRLAACAQVSAGVRSFYQWQGQMAEETEFQLTIKSRRDLFGELCAELRKLHSYDVPEIVALPLVDGAESYLRWMDEELQPPRGV